jgi:phosphoenolpyruvate-protein kinase (PTS system EI component)
MQINEEKRKKFMEFAGKRVNNVLHDIQILEPMSRSSAYDFTKQDVDEMFSAMQETLNNTRAEFERKFEEKAKAEKKTFSFGSSLITDTEPVSNSNETNNDYSYSTEYSSTASYSNECSTAENVSNDYTSPDVTSETSNLSETL